MASAVEKQLENTINDLEAKIRNLNDEMNFLLYQFDTCYVDANEDNKILSYLGATDVIFAEVDKKFERGENLIKLVNKITKSNIANIEGQDNSGDNIPSIDMVIFKFIASEKPDIHLKVMGEKDDGEMFMLVWKIKRYEKHFRHFFKVIPTNQINKLSLEKQAHNLDNLKGMFKSLINLLDTGIIVLDVSQRILFINDAAKEHFIPSNTSLIKNANFDTKNYKDLIFMCDQEEMNFRLDANKTVLDSKKQVTFQRNFDNKILDFWINPIFDKINELHGLSIITKYANQSKKEASQPKVDIKKLLLTIKHYTNQNKVLYERISELETNQRWFMRNNSNYESTIKELYTDIDNIPYPVSFIEMPSHQIVLINSAFHKAINLEKKQILGKTDKDIFPEDMAAILYEKNIETAEQKILCNFTLRENLNIKQSPFMDFNNNRMMIARVYNYPDNIFNF